MTIREKLILNKEIEARNKVREEEFLQAQKVEAIHRTVEAYAKVTYGFIDTVAGDYDVACSEVLDLLISTLQALNQIKEQEG